MQKDTLKSLNTVAHNVTADKIFDESAESFISECVI